MASSVVLCAAFDCSAIGTCTYTLTDSAGAHAPFNLSAAGIREPGALINNAGAKAPTPESLIDYFVAQLNAASPTVGYTGFWSSFTGKYTIVAGSGTFSIACSGTGPAAAMFGESSSLASSGTTWTSSYVPKYVIVPARPGVSVYVQPKRVANATKERVTQSGRHGAQRHTTVPRIASWEHRFEPKYMVDDDARGGTLDTITQLYSWESLWSDHGLGRLPIGICINDGVNYETFAFSLIDRDYSESVVKRRAPNDDGRFTITVRARLWPTSTANRDARAFNV